MFVPLLHFEDDVQSGRIGMVQQRIGLCADLHNRPNRYLQ